MAATDQPLPPVWEGLPPAAALPAPGLLYLTGEEFLRASAMANVANITVEVRGRVLAPDNTIKRHVFQFTPGGTRTFTSQVAGLSSGWLLDFTMRAVAGTPTFGSIYGIFEIGVGQGAGFLPLQTLREGFFTTNTPLSCATSISMLPLDGPGALRSITGATPGAGADISETVPTGARWQLLDFRTKFVTSAVVANRNSILTLDDGANEYARYADNANTAASSTVFLTWMTGSVGQNNGANNMRAIGIAGPQLLGAGHRIKTTTVNIDVGDQYSLVQYLTREWMTGE